MGSIVVKEDRQTVNKFQSWYQEKMIASGNAARFEKVISKVYDFNRSYTDVKGKVLPVIITFIPEASFLKPVIPVITKVEHKMYDLGENVLLGGKRFIEANFIGVDGSSKEVVLPDIDVKGLVDDAVQSVNVVKDAVDNYEMDSEKVGRSR